MNKIYSLVWNRSRSQVEVASELARKAGATSGGRGGQAGVRRRWRLSSMSAALIVAGMFGSPSAFAGYGIFFNDGVDNGCTWTFDTQGMPPIGTYSGTTAPSAANSGGNDTVTGVYGQPVPTNAQLGGTANVQCTSADKATQTNRVLFYGPSSGVGSNSLTLGGDLYANRGNFGLGGGQTGTTQGSMRIGGTATLAGTSGTNAIAIGGGTTTTTATVASGNSSIAIGLSSVSSGASGVAIGTQSTAGANSVAFGVGAKAANTSNGGIAIGQNASASGTGSSNLAIGANAVANGVAAGLGDSTAIGTGASATGQDSTAVGGQTTASATNTLAVGNNGTTASATGATAFGVKSTATAAYALAAGTSANASAAGAIAVGSNATAAATAAAVDAIAIGGQSSVVGAATSGIALGRGATVNGAFGIAQGDGVVSGATGRNVAIGSSGTTANGGSAAGGAVAIGRGQQATGDGAVAIGDPNTVNGTGAVALGADNVAAGDASGATAAVGAVAIGNANRAIGSGSVALGDSSSALQQGAVAIGETATSNGSRDIAIGDSATTDAVGGATNPQPDNVAMGTGAAASGGGSVAIGQGAVGTGSNTAGNNNATAVGSQAQVNDYNGTALGASASTGTGATYATAIGSAATVAAGAGQAVAIGSAAQANAERAVAIGSFAEANGYSSMAFGQGAVSDGDVSTAIGQNASSTADRGIAVGMDSQANGVDSIASGTEAIAAGVNDTVIGNHAITFLGGGNTALGNGANAGTTDGSGGNNTALGNNSSATAVAATALGDASFASGKVSVALGAHAQVGIEGGVALGAYSVASTLAGSAGYVPAAASAAQEAAINATTSTMGAVSVGDAANGEFRQITGVAAGTANSDAVNVSQLKALADAVDGSAVHYFSVNDGGVQGDNYANDGALGVNSVALGVGASTASGASDAIAFGTDAAAGGATALAIGKDALADFANDMAIGNGAHATGDISGISPAMAVGVGATASQSFDMAFGTLAAATGGQSLAFGYGATASGLSSTAFGTQSAATATNAFALGGFTYADGKNSTSIGGATTSSDYSVAIGDMANTQGTAAYGVAIGANSAVSSTGSDTNVALGADSVADGSTLSTAAYNPGTTTVAGMAPAGEVSVGSEGSERRITRVAAGGADTDAVNVSQLKALADVVDGSETHYFSVNDGGVQGDNYANDGATGANAVAIGVDARAFSPGSIAQGDGATAYGQGDIAIGTGATSSGESDLGGSLINGSAVAIGDGATTGGVGAVALGMNSHAQVFEGVAIGYGASANNANDVALGANSATQATVATTGATIAGTAYTFAGAAPESTVSVGSAGNERTITNVAAGRLGGGSTDAVNGSQLYATNQAVEGMDGQLDDLGDQVTTNTTNIATNTTDITALQQDALQWNPTLGAYDASHGSGTAQKIANVAAGSAATDAVNVSQLGDAAAAAASEVQAGTNVAGVDTATAADGHTVYTVNADGARVVAGDGVDVDATAAADNITDYTVGLSQATKDSLAEADSAMQGVVTQVDGTTVKTLDKDDNTANFVSGKNIALGDDGAGGIEVATADDVDFTSVTTGNTVMNDGGVTVSGGANPVSLTAAGLDNGGNTITNVAAGSAATDAVNVSQLGDATAAAASEVQAGTNVAGVDTSTATDGHTVYTVNADGARVVAGDGVDVDTTAAADNITDYTVGLSQATKDSLAAADSAMQGVVTQVDGTTVKTLDKDDNTANFVSGKNIALGDDGAGGIEVATADDVDFTSVTTGNTVMNDGGVTVSGGANPVSLTATGLDNGGNIITNVAAGSNDTDAVNVAQLNALSDAVDGSAVHYFSVNDGGVQGDNYANDGAGAPNSIAIGVGAQATGPSAIAQGDGAWASGGWDIAIGADAVSSGESDIGGSLINGPAVAIGNGAVTGGVGAVALGTGSHAQVFEGTALGYGASANNANDVALGAESTTQATVATTGATIAGTAYTFAGAAPESTVSVGSAGNERTITHVAAGRLGDGSTDAVNGSQLYATNQAIDDVDGQLDDLGDQVTTNTTNIATNTTNITDNSTDITALQQDALQWNPTLGAYDASHGSGTAQKIANVAAGSDDTDAVNVAQLNALSDTVDATASHYVSINDGGVQGGNYANDGATGTNAVAIGVGAVADGDGATAVGPSAAASGLRSISIGRQAGMGSDGDYNAVVGPNAGQDVQGNSNAAFGNAAGNTVTGNNNLAAGQGAGGIVQGDNNMALGRVAGQNVVGNANVALGMSSGAMVGGDRNIVVGVQAGTNVQGNRNAAVGVASGTDVQGDNNAVLGMSAGNGVTGTGNLALGVNAGNSVDGSQNIGVGVAAGQNVTGTSNIAQGGGAGQYVAGDGNIATGFTAGQQVAGEGNVAIGLRAGSFATQTELDNAVSIGTDALASADDAIAIGHGAQAAGALSIAVGTGNVVSGDNSGAFGDPNTVNGNGSYAVGNNNTIDADNVFVLGSNVAVAAGLDGAVALGADSTVAASTIASYNPGTGTLAGTALGSNVVSVGSAGGERRITNVAAGGADTDAVNVSQLKALDGKIGDLSGNAVQYDDATKGSVTLAGPASTDGGVTGGTTLTNVHQGDVSADSTDAVNGSQLYQTNQDVAQNTTDITNLDNRVTTIYDTGAKYFHANSTGPDSNPVGVDSVAIGPSAVANNANDVALGAGAVTAAAVGTANAIIDGVTYTFAGVAPTATLSIGAAGQERTLTNLAAGRLGAGSTDAVNGSQLYAAMQAIDLIGSEVDAIGGGVTGMFQVSADRISPAPAPTGTDSAAGGAGATAAGNGSLAVGNDSNAAGDQSVAVGHGATASGAGSAALGQGAVAAADGSVAIGQGASDGGRGAESYTGKYSGAANDSVGTVSVGNAATGATRTVSNVADGREATDAVNVRQLDGAVQEAKDYTDTQIANIGGSVTDITNGSAGMFQVSTDANTEQPQASGAKSTAGGNGAVASADGSTAVGHGAQATAAGSVALGEGSVASRADSVSVGSAGHERQVTNVAAGTAATDAVNVGQLEAAQAGAVRYDTRSDGSVDYTSVTMNAGGDPTVVHNVGAGTAPTDAVNVGQLDSGVQKAMDWSKSYTDRRFETIDQNINTIGNRANAGIASSMAMASLPQAYAPNQSSAAVALGSFHGETGIAIGVSTVTESGRYVFKLNATSNTRGDAGVGVGAAVVW